MSGHIQETVLHCSLIIRRPFVARPSVDPFPLPTWLSRFSPSFSVPSFTWNLISWLAEGRRWRRRANMAEKAKKVEGTVSLQNISRRPSQELSYWLLKTLKILITVSPCTNNETIQLSITLACESTLKGEGGPLSSKQDLKQPRWLRAGGKGCRLLASSPRARPPRSKVGPPIRFLNACDISLSNLRFLL